MTLNQLKEILTGLRTGDRACISYDIYGVLFPPGEPDVDARARCYEFAKLAACQIENDPRNSLRLGQREIGYLKWPSKIARAVDYKDSFV